MKKKHVLIIVQNLSVPYDRRVWLECNSLIENGFDVSVICPRAEGDSKKEKLNNVSIYRYAPAPITSSVFSFIVEFSYCFLRTFILALKIQMKSRINIIQTCNPPDTYWLLGLFFRLFGTKFVFDQHDLCPEVFDARFGEKQKGLKKILRKILMLLEKMNYKVASKVISTNESYKEIAINRGKKNKDDVVIVRSGPNPEKLYPIDKDLKLLGDKKYMLVYIGVMGPQDRVDIAIDAMDEIVNKQNRKEIKLVLLGDGDCFNELKERTNNLELSEFVEFKGKANDEVIRKYFSTACLGIAPDPATRFNSHSTHNKIMEYMIFSLPVVCFELKETIKSGQDALSIVKENADPIAMANSIIELIDNDEIRIEKGKFGRERVLKYLTWEHQSQAYVEVFKSLH